MKLLQCLQVGQALMSVGNGGRYQMRDQNCLPKFNRQLVLDLNSRTLTPAPAALDLQPEAPPVPGFGARLDGPVAPILKTPSPKFRSSARATGPLRQAELSLENVKVVCNDLRDSDVELVIKRNRPVETGSANNPRMTTPPAPRPWLGWLGNMLARTSRSISSAQ